jgi:hypothetical protein
MLDKRHNEGDDVVSDEAGFTLHELEAREKNGPTTSVDTSEKAIRSFVGKRAKEHRANDHVSYP